MTYFAYIHTRLKHIDMHDSLDERSWYNLSDQNYLDSIYTLNIAFCWHRIDWQKSAAHILVHGQAPTAPRTTTTLTRWAVAWLRSFG